MSLKVKIGLVLGMAVVWEVAEERLWRWILRSYCWKMCEVLYCHTKLCLSVFCVLSVHHDWRNLHCLLLDCSGDGCLITSFSIFSWGWSRPWTVQGWSHIQCMWFWSRKGWAHLRRTLADSMEDYEELGKCLFKLAHQINFWAAWWIGSIKPCLYGGHWTGFTCS